MIKSTKNFTVKSSVFQYQDLVVRQLNPFHKNKEGCCFFNRIIFNYQIVEYRHIQQREIMQHCGPIFVVRVILFSIYKIYKRFLIFQGGFQVLKLRYFKLLCQKHIQNLLKDLRWSFLLKAVKSFQKKFILDIWVLNKLLIATIDSNMCYYWKVTLKIH